MTEQAREVEKMATEHAAAWTSAETDRIAEIFAEEGSISVNGGEPTIGHVEIIEQAKGLLATFPGLVVHCHETRHAGDRAVFVWTLEGRHAETGNLVSLPGWHEWELNENMKVERCRGYYDEASLERQVAGQ